MTTTLTDAQKDAYIRSMREQLRAIVIAVRYDDWDHPDGPFLNTTSIAALEMADKTIADLDNLIGE